MAKILRVLIIEDTPDRQNVLTSLYCAHAWVLVHTGERAIKLLGAYDFDIISLALVYPVSKMIRTNRHFKRLRAELDNHGIDFDWKNPIH